MTSPKRAQNVADTGCVPTPLSSDQRRRYARQLALPGFGERAQQALRDARVLVVGAGGLGSPVLAYLAGAGVGVLGIVDDDVVETSNLQRQIIHRDDAVGTAKVESAGRFVAGLNPEVRVERHDVRLDATSVLGVLAGYDVVVDGTDNFETRYLLNDACVLLGVPLVWASISEFSGQLGVSVPDVGPCYRCLFPQAPAPGTVLNCAEGGVLGVLPGVVGSMQAVEAIKLITGLGGVLDHGVLVYDALTAATSVLPLQRDPACAACGSGVPPQIGVGAAIPEVGPAELRAAAVVVDVREPDEVAAHPLAGAVRWPLSAWDDVETARFVQHLPTGDVVTVCASGVRSRTAAQQLIDAGLDPARVASLRGGVAHLDEVSAGSDA